MFIPPSSLLSHLPSLLPHPLSSPLHLPTPPPHPLNLMQLLFSGQEEYSSELWKQLTTQCNLFMSEKVVLQYIGFVKTHMKLIERGKHKGTPRERKLFYQVSVPIVLEKRVRGGGGGGGGGGTKNIYEYIITTLLICFLVALFPSRCFTSSYHWRALFEEVHQ